MSDNKIFKKTFCIFLLIMFFALSFDVYATGLGSGFDYGNVPVDKADDSAVDQVSKPIKKAWGTVLFAMQILSVAGVICVGVKYMISSGDQKAIIKKNTVYMIIGIIIVFAFSTFIKYIIDVTNIVISTY